MLVNFLADTVSRLFGKTPMFFKIVRWAALILAVITGLPEFLTTHGVVLPDAWNAVASKVVSIASIIAAFVAQLTVTENVKATLRLKN